VSNDGPHLTDIQLTQLLESQQRQAGVRLAEIELEKQKDDHAFEFGKQSIAAKTSDLKDTRAFLSGQTTRTFLFLGFLIASVAGVIVYALMTGKDSVAMEIIKAIVLLSAGALGGGGYVKSQSASQKGSDK
jgi:hypothetical protein